MPGRAGPHVREHGFADRRQRGRGGCDAGSQHGAAGIGLAQRSQRPLSGLRAVDDDGGERLTQCRLDRPPASPASISTRSSSVPSTPSTPASRSAPARAWAASSASLQRLDPRARRRDARLGGIVTRPRCTRSSRIRPQRDALFGPLDLDRRAGSRPLGLRDSRSRSRSDSAASCSSLPRSSSARLVARRSSLSLRSVAGGTDRSSPRTSAAHSRPSAPPSSAVSASVTSAARNGTLLLQRRAPRRRARLGRARPRPRRVRRGTWPTSASRLATTPAPSS